ncbi:hypothetical protein EPO56_00720 [Patescibacteria group bacterium]|nr:MAG: hypothetical protein EPO56_00720 [Patescibacteria group bacterium]
MNKSKWFALVFGILLLSGGYATYARTQNHFERSRLIVTNPVQHISNIAPQGALHVPFTKVNLTARGTDIIVNKITVVRTGPADDGAFEDIVLLNSEGEVLGDGSLDGEHTVHFSEPIYIPRNTTIRLTVAANMAEDLAEFEGQISALVITDIQASGFLPVNLKP